MAVEYDVAVVGGGAAGLAATGCAAAGGARVACFEAAAPYGGLIANVGRLDGYPSPQPLPGPALIDLLLARARDAQTSFIEAPVTRLEKGGERLRVTAGGKAYSVHRAIVASGASLRRAGFAGEAEFAGRGVSQCSWCDGGLFRGKRVVVVGGGDAALQSALHLAELCSAVAIVVRGATLRASNEYAARAADNPRIQFHWQTEVEAVLGGRAVERALLRESGSEQRTEYACQGVFVFAGVQPNCDFAPALARDEAGAVRTDAQLRTSLPGTFAVGAVRSGYGGALLSALGEGATAAAAALGDLRTAGAV